MSYIYVLGVIFTHFMKVKKNRVVITKEFAAEVLYLNDRTCCVCNERGKSIQIHHIDKDPSNNSLDNLSVLCLECHNDTQAKGGFGRRLDAEQVLVYKKGWELRVQERRLKTDDFASIKIINNISDDRSDILIEDYQQYLNQYFEDFPFTQEHEAKRLCDYLNKIADIKKTVYKFANQKIKTEQNVMLNQATDEIIDFYEEILNELASFYPEKHFDGDSKKFFNELISLKFEWHRHIRDTFGLGRNGSMIRGFVSHAVIIEVDQMIVTMVDFLTEKYYLKSVRWIEKWNKTK